MTDPSNRSISDDTISALVASLRSQMEGRIQAQHQLIVVTVAIAGASLSFGKSGFEGHSEILALLALLFVALALAILRHEHEITIIIFHLLDRDSVGANADAHAGWEARKFIVMQQSGSLALLASVTQTIGIYSVPIVAAVAFGAAALSSSPTWRAWCVLGLAGLFAVAFALGAVDVVRRYRDLGHLSKRMLPAAQTESAERIP